MTPPAIVFMFSSTICALDDEFVVLYCWPPITVQRPVKLLVAVRDVFVAVACVKLLSTTSPAPPSAPRG